MHSKCDEICIELNGISGAIVDDFNEINIILQRVRDMPGVIYITWDDETNTLATLIKMWNTVSSECTQLVSWITSAADNVVGISL